MTKKPLYAFCHIEKASGTSLIHELRRAFLFRFADVRPLVRRKTVDFLAADLRQYQRIVPGLRCIAGHSVTPDSDLATAHPEIHFITVLREPFSRMESHYLHWKQRKGYRGSFRDFILQEHIQNFMCKKISKEASAAAAVQTIEERFVAVGVMENLDPFYRQLYAAIPDFPLISSLRHANQRWSKQTVDFCEDDLDVFRRFNKEDVALYEWAVTQAEAPEGKNCARKPVLNSRYFSDYADYAFRKAWLEPVTGLVRVRNGLPYRGSYQVDIYG
jgi:hypothetical protein